ncbi:hypothetical protein FB565_005083 [Actinoplanes lutulentus]|uniref:hypothetical protein n=1 Tax=Actinoplanes lutulentus TaxID=1287878 RepID=UPI000DBA9A64|nr:hypothetical protein [Actinoplanes lutulentus]MBB2945350.1 hypothetical protein [Actinoplanes lutulentus]
MTTKRHPDPDVRTVLKEAERAGWRLKLSTGGNSHIFGSLMCPGEQCTPVWVLSTPSGSSQAKILRRNMARCPHNDTSDSDGR